MGIGYSEYFPPDNNYVIYLTIYSNDTNNNISFLAYSQTSGEILDLNETVNFISDNNIGNGFKPYIFTGSAQTFNENKIPDSYYLFQNYPNPFNLETRINFKLPETSNVSLKIIGQEIKILLDEMVSLGNHSVKWDGTNDRGAKMISGVYIYKIRMGNYTDVKKMILLK